MVATQLPHGSLRNTWYTVQLAHDVHCLLHMMYSSASVPKQPRAADHREAKMMQQIVELALDGPIA